VYINVIESNYTMKGQKLGYIRVSTVEQNTARQLEGLVLDRIFTDKASGKDVHRPALTELLGFAREGDLVICHSMDRLARNLDDLRRIVKDLTAKGVKVQFTKEGLTFTGEDSPMATLLLSIMASFAELEVALLRERQMEGIAIAKKAGRYKGRKKKLTAEQVKSVRELISNGAKKAAVAREFQVSRATLYQYLKSKVA
jgi:DNA invertase Pin-like site-specific DNA recombinase